MKKKSKYNIAVVGAKGAVGHEIIKILEDRKFPTAELRLFGSSRSAGSKVRFRGKEIEIRELQFQNDDFKGIDIVLSSPGASISRKFVPHALAEGAIVVDNTSAFRMDPKVPLVIPEINAEDIKKHQGIIANPNCSAIIMLIAVAPLHKKNKIKRILCATYQAVSGAGANAMIELYKQSEEFIARVKSNPFYEGDLLKAIEEEVKETQSDEGLLKREVFPHQIAFNLFSHNSSIEESGYNGEELKMIQESRKILHDNSIRIATTCIRVPVLRAHSEVVYLEFSKKMTAAQAKRILSKAAGVRLVDEPKNNYYPMPIKATGGDDVLVGRVRQDLSLTNGLALFVAGDQLRKGAALNAVQIAEHLIRKSF